MSAETWDQMHGEPTKQQMMTMDSIFSQGGVSFFG